MEYIVDFLGKDGDYDSITVYADCDEDCLCTLLNAVLANKNIQEVTGVETITDSNDYDIEEEEEY